MPEYLTLKSEPCHSQFMKGYSIHVFNTTFRMFPDFFSQSVSPRPRKKLEMIFSLFEKHHFRRQIHGSLDKAISQPKANVYA